jgi:hypothetical protein
MMTSNLVKSFLTELIEEKIDDQEAPRERRLLIINIPFLVEAHKECGERVVEDVPDFQGTMSARLRVWSPSLPRMTSGLYSIVSFLTWSYTRL